MSSKLRIFFIAYDGVTGFREIFSDILGIANELNNSGHFEVAVCYQTKSRYPPRDIAPYKFKFFHFQLLSDLHASLETFNPQIIYATDFWPLLEIKGKSKAKLVYDAHFTSYDWFHNHPFYEFKDLRILENGIRYNLIELKLEFARSKSGITLESEAMQACELIIANSLTTSKTVQRYSFGHKTILAPVISRKFLERTIPPFNFPKQVASFDSMNTIRKGMFRILKHSSFPFDLKCYGYQPGEELIIQPSAMRYCHPWMIDPETYAKTILQHPFVLFPSAYESFGLSLSDCLSLGRICIAQSTNPGFQEQIQHGVNGFLVDFRQDSWIAEVEKFLNLPSEELTEIAKNAYSFWKEQQLAFDRKKIILAAIRRLTEKL